jgi:hypothetical protein
MQEILKPKGLKEVQVAPPDPPDELSEDEAAEWRKIVGHMPPDYFRQEVYPILIELCRHICLSRLYYEKLKFLNQHMQDKRTISAAIQMARLHALESRIVAMLLARLGVTKRVRQGSMIREIGRQGGRRPWELSRGDTDFVDDEWNEDVESDDFEAEDLAERKATHLS